MEAHAHVVARGDVLNIGFGLGLVDEVRARIARSHEAGRIARQGRGSSVRASLLLGRAWRAPCGAPLCALVGGEVARIKWALAGSAAASEGAPGCRAAQAIQRRRPRSHTIIEARARPPLPAAVPSLASSACYCATTTALSRKGMSQQGHL